MRYLCLLALMAIVLSARAAEPTLALTLTATPAPLASGASWTYEVRITTGRPVLTPIVFALTLDDAGERVRITGWEGARSCGTAATTISCSLTIDATHPALLHVIVQSSPDTTGEIGAWAWATLGQDGVLTLAQQEAFVRLQTPLRIYMPVIIRP